jgi:plastocyanin
MLNLRVDTRSTRQQKGGGGLRAPRFFAAALLTGCFCVSGIMPAVADGRAGSVAEVVIEKMEFIPSYLQIKAGTAVTWINKEKRNNHSVLFEQENMLESDRFFPGETYQRTFDKPGTYPYRCGPHPEMRGVIEVVE